MGECPKKPLTSIEARRMAKGAKYKGGKSLISYRCPICHTFHLMNVQEYRAPKHQPYRRREKHVRA